MKNSWLKIYGIFVLGILLQLSVRAQKRRSDIVMVHRAPVSLESLLKEMIQPGVLARFPDPVYQSMEVSSYNRASKSPDEKGWFADSDGTGYIREEDRDGKKEYVIMEHTGPGCITRMWTPFFYYDLQNHVGPNIHIYIDGKRVMTENFIQLLSGQSFIRPPFANMTTRAGVSYLPIPFVNSCKITLDQKPFYYCVNFRSYPVGTKVVSFSRKAYVQANGVLAESGSALLHPDQQLVIKDSQEMQVHLSKGDSATFNLPAGPGAICRMKFKLDGISTTQAINNVGLIITFDGHQTISCPLGAFFCSDSNLNDFQTKYRTVRGKDVMISRWVMPYQQSAKIKIINFSSHDISMSLKVERSSWVWDERSMYFHANWCDYGYLPGNRFFDLNFIHIRGKGILVGDALTVLSPGVGWWGEGDEKIYVDGDIDDRFPSHFGTGTEDYYGWAGGEIPTWKDTFSIPFAANVRNGNRENPRGYNICTRSRALDAIPFEQALKFDMEASPGVDIRHKYNLLAYSMVTFWYGRPNAISNSVPSYDELKQTRMVLLEIDSLEKNLRSGALLLDQQLLQNKVDSMSLFIH